MAGYQKPGFLRRQLDYYALNVPFTLRQMWRNAKKAFGRLTVEDTAKAILPLSLLAPQAAIAAAPQYAPTEQVYEVSKEEPSEEQKQLAAANVNLLSNALSGMLVATPEQTIWTPWRGYLGATAGNHYDGFSGEALIPLKERTKNDLPFLYIIGGADFDLRHWHGAAGGGYRFFEGDGPVLGINALWGQNDTGENNFPWARIQGEAFALGPGRNIEGNASYKWAWEDAKRKDELITNDAITRWYEQLLEGFHGEIGIWHPTLEDMATGVLPGYGKYQGDMDGFTCRIEFDAGKAILAIDYSDIPDHRGWFVSLKHPFGEGSPRKPKLYQSNAELLLEPVRIQRHQYHSKVIQNPLEHPQEEPKEELPPLPPFPKPNAVYQQNLIDARREADRYIQNALGLSARVKPDHPHGQPPGQAKKEPPDQPF